MIITPADAQYRTMVEDIFKHGTYIMDRTGTGALKLWGQEFNHRPAKFFPILTSKKVNYKSAVKEMLWIYQDQSNDVNLLKEKYGVKIWDEWAQEDGTIGKAYGYQVKKHGLIDKLIHDLKNNPADRAMIMSLWNHEDLPEMALRPCAFMTMWDVDPALNELNMTLIQRSGDMGLGVPFNMVQYAVLQAMIAQVTGYKVGGFKHVINNAHIYIDHINPLREQLSRDRYKDEEGEKLLSGFFELNPEVTDFYDFTPDDVTIRSYHSHTHIPMKVSV